MSAQCTQLSLEKVENEKRIAQLNDKLINLERCIDEQQEKEQMLTKELDTTKENVQSLLAQTNEIPKLKKELQVVPELQELVSKLRTSISEKEYLLSKEKSDHELLKKENINLNELVTKLERLE